MKSEYPGISKWLLAEINNYVVKGELYSEFIHALLTNNLKESFARADDGNADNMKHIVWYLYREIPSDAWGNEEKINSWMKSGLVGQERSRLSEKLKEV